MHTDAAVGEGDLLPPAAVGKLLEAELVAVVVRLGEHEGVVLQVREESEEAAESSVQVVQVCVRLPLLHF